MSKTAEVESIDTSTTAVVLNPGTGPGAGVYVHNLSAVVLYVLCGEGDASATNFTAAIAANTNWEAPAGFSGRLSGILASATGSALVTRLGS